MKKVVKRLHSINAFTSLDNKTTLIGRDEEGDEFQIWFDTFELLSWLEIKYMKEKVKEHIDKL